MGGQPGPAESAAREPFGCQIQSPPRYSEGVVRLRDAPVRKRARLALRRRLPLSFRRKLKQRLVQMGYRLHATPVPVQVRTDAHAPVFEAGGLVRVRSREEIEATLDPWKQLRGCGFMEEMVPYCGTTQRVLKPVLRFVDERDYKVKKARGVYLLDGLMCEGAEPYGRCDRGCLYFWRGEWLEPLSAGSAESTEA